MTMHYALIHRRAGQWPKEKAAGALTLDFEALLLLETYSYARTRAIGCSSLESPGRCEEISRATSQ